jgi:hypothetical protein
MKARMRPPKKRDAAPAGTGNGVEFRDAFSEGNPLMALYPTVGVSATIFAAAVIARRYHLTPPTARLVRELAGIGGGL